MSVVNEKQIGGMHYKAAFQHWDLVAYNDMGYFVGQITKYVTRWKKKNGVQDVEKSIHYCDKLIELIKEEIVPIPEKRSAYSLTKFCKENGLIKLEKDIFILACTYTSMQELQDLREKLDELLEMAKNTPSS
jgi:hypothetical protein